MLDPSPSYSPASTFTQSEPDVELDPSSARSPKIGLSRPSQDNVWGEGGREVWQKTPTTNPRLRKIEEEECQLRVHGNDGGDMYRGGGGSGGEVAMEMAEEVVPRGQSRPGRCLVGHV